MKRALLTMWIGALLLAPVAMSAKDDGTRTGARVPYVSGGIGLASQERLNSLAKEFKPKLVFTLTEGACRCVNVALKDGAGRNVLKAFPSPPESR